MRDFFDDQRIEGRWLLLIVVILVLWLAWLTPASAQEPPPLPPAPAECTAGLALQWEPLLEPWVVGYVVRMGLAPSGLWLKFPTSTPWLACDDPRLSLLPGTLYWWSVTAVDLAGDETQPPTAKQIRLPAARGTVSLKGLMVGPTP